MTNEAKKVMRLIATNSSKIRSLPIEDGQLVFIQDLGRIAFDFKGKRVFYNQIVELNTEAERLTLDNPLDGYYFVIGSGCLWFYRNEWTQITEKPENVLFIGVELPELGQEDKLYINKAEQNISVWDDETNQYVVVADCTKEVTYEDIEILFN